MGIPDYAIKSAQEKAKAKKIKGWLFTIDFPSYLPVLQYADNRDLRKDMYYAFNTKASSHMSKKLDNTSNINEILKLKYQLSKLLGFSNISSMLLKTKWLIHQERLPLFYQN